MSIIGNPTGLVSYYTLDDLTDSHGSNDLTNDGATSTTGLLNDAYSFDEQGDKITGSPINNVRTISVWVYFESFGSTYDQVIVEQRASNGWYFIIDHEGRNPAGAMHIIDDDGTSNHCRTSALSWNDQTWYHLVFVKTGSETGSFYRDGSLVSTGTCYLTTDNYLDNQGTTLSLGSYYSVPVDFNGKIDELSLWNIALTSDEVSELYNSATPLEYEVILNGIQEANEETNTTVSQTNASTVTIRDSQNWNPAPVGYDGVSDLPCDWPDRPTWMTACEQPKRSIFQRYIQPTLNGWIQSLKPNIDFDRGGINATV
jgi:hypothetical protein